MIDILHCPFCSEIYPSHERHTCPSAYEILLRDQLIAEAAMAEELFDPDELELAASSLFGT